MAINNSRPMKFTPTGLVDAFDSSMKFPGACQRLQNLIFDQSNPELVVSRPGVTLLVDLQETGSFANPAFISVFVVVGTRIYGMVSTDRNPGKDEPFCYDTATDSVVVIDGVTAANCPTSPSGTGAWVPPTIANVGVMILFTHPGFTGAGKNLWGGGALWGAIPTGSGALWGDSYTFGMIDATDPDALTWNATTTKVNSLGGVPQAVANFNNRPWFAVGNLLQYCDVLTNPPTRTTADQEITVGDSQDITALNGLPVQTASSGITQTLTTFKTTQVWQVGGDPATWNLSLDQISLTVGCNAPRSIALSPYGLYFSSSGGPYFLDLIGGLKPLTYSGDFSEPDVQAPFENATQPTRSASAYNSTVYRVCIPTIVRGRQGTNDYWFDEHRRRWNGPHTFVYDCAGGLGSNFVLSGVGYPGKIMQSATQQTQNFVNTDLSTLMTCSLLSSTFPKTNDMAMKQVVESQIELSASGGNITYNIEAQDEQGKILGSATIAIKGSGSPWGSFSWDDGTLWGGSPLWGGGSLWGAPSQIWGTEITWGQDNPIIYWTQAAGSGEIWGAGTQNVPQTLPVPWKAPMVFEKMQLQVKATASAEVAIGTFYARYQRTGYMTRGIEG
jgi:hypothetical protein